MQSESKKTNRKFYFCIVLEKVGIKYLKQHSSSTAKSRIQSGNNRYAAIEDPSSVAPAYKLKDKLVEHRQGIGEYLFAS